MYDKKNINLKPKPHGTKIFGGQDDEKKLAKRTKEE